MVHDYNADMKAADKNPDTLVPTAEGSYFVKHGYYYYCLTPEENGWQVTDGVTETKVDTLEAGLEFIKTL